MENNITTETVGTGVIKTTYVDDGIVVLSVQDSHRESIDTWVKTVEELVKTWPDNQPYKVIHDASKVFFSPYFRRQAEYISKRTVEIRGEDYQINIAIVLADNPTAHILRLFLRRVIRPSFSAWRMEMFNQVETALSWMRNLDRELE
ncbi:MAG: hypothetical protein L0154_06115 [Chloroflexi bacterium]|nr:hypothetical protein [Chloroflexota bacterium]